jgi:polysaccharide pyruvyl transferase WcaK-like protein
VTRNWSAEGRRLFTDGLRNARLIDVTVRDARSQTIWDDLLTGVGVRAAGHALDPGLLTARHFASAAASGSAGIGFCITDPVALRYHSAAGAVSDNLTAWYSDAIAALAASGRSVSLFTNGSPEDELFLASNADRWAAHPGVSVVPSFERPANLVQFISRCDVVVAHRMHACIAAHSYGIPTIGLAWDLKLNSFFDGVGRSTWLVDPGEVAATELPGLVSRAQVEGIDPAALAQLIESCRTDVARLAATLQSAIGAR